MTILAPATDLPEVDVVGIARGGLVAHQLRVPLSVLRVNYRDDNRPRADEPRLRLPNVDLTGQWVLSVDDVSGATLRFAATCLGAAAHVTTLTLEGQAEIVFFSEVHSCVNWPWSLP